MVSWKFVTFIDPLNGGGEAIGSKLKIDELSRGIFKKPKLKKMGIFLFYPKLYQTNCYYNEYYTCDCKQIYNFIFTLVNR